MEDDFEETAAVTRRSLLAGSAAIYGAAGTTRATSSDRQPRTTRRAVIPELGQPFEGNYVGQYVVFPDSSPRTDVSPSAVADCDFAAWAPDRTSVYEAILLDRTGEDPQAARVPLFMDATKAAIESGNGFIINRVHDCPGEFRGLELEDVPVRSFAPEYGTVTHPLVGESPGPTVSPTETGTGTEGEVPGVSLPGFGVLTGLVGIAGAAAIRLLRRER